MSGHSKWSTIKRKKAANDARRGNLFTRLAREIAVAAREGGGDPEVNFTLRLAIDRAKEANMPKDNIERAIRRGTGEDKSEADLERVMYEGYAPHSVALMIEVVTDNRNRTVADIRHTLNDLGGSMADAGSVSWQFQRSAYFVIPLAEHDQDQVFEIAVDSGAEDVIIGEEDIEVLAPVEHFKRLSDAFKSAGIKTELSEPRMMPKSTVPLNQEKTLRVMKLIEEIEELDDVQEVFSNLEISDEAVAMIEAA